ncbi:MAG: hypothetical protein ACQERZ_02140 [Fusobacteriota bacterium]
MKRKEIIFFVILILSSMILGKGMDPTMQGESRKIDVTDEFEFNGNKNFVGNGGPLVGVMALDLNSLNNDLKKVGLPELTENEYGDNNLMFMFGGGGIGGTFKNRFGGYGASGKISNSKENQKVTLKFDYGGFIYEKGLFMIEKTKTNLSLGFLAGGGTASLHLIYDDIENDFITVINNPHTNVLTKEYLVFSPRLNIHQKLGAFIGVDFSAEYLLNFDMGESWTLDDEEVKGPLSNTQSPSFTARLSFGF